MACKLTLWGKIKRIFDLSRSQELVDRVAEIDKRNREVKHEVRGLAQRADALKHLVLSMREDATWRDETPPE
jgi:hypothetical protein